MKTKKTNKHINSGLSSKGRQDIKDVTAGVSFLKGCLSYIRSSKDTLSRGFRRRLTNLNIISEKGKRKLSYINVKASFSLFFITFR